MFGLLLSLYLGSFVIENLFLIVMKINIFQSEFLPLIFCIDL